MWLKETGVEGFTIQYKKMALHAISRDPNVHPRDCLYVMINGSLDGSDGKGWFQQRRGIRFCGIVK